MESLTAPIKFFLKTLITVTILILILSSNITVYANGGPPHYVVDGDVEFLIPIKSSNIEIKSERLSYHLNDFTDKTMLADISAKYEMCNTSEENVDVLIAFVTNNSMRPLDVIFRDEPVEIIRTETLDWNKYPIKPQPSYVHSPTGVLKKYSNLGHWKEFGVWEPTFKEIMFYFSTGIISEDFDPSFNYNLVVTLFEISFNPNEVCEMYVSYRERATFITDNFNYSGGSGHNPRFQFYYLLEPAQYWKDFSNLSITVGLPTKLNTKFSLDGFTLDEETNTYTAQFDKLPDKNLEILVYKYNKIKKPNLLSSFEVIIYGALICIILVPVIIFIVITKIIRAIKRV